MAWSGSGVFNRLYSWVTDRDNGVPIDSTKMDAEMDGMATGITACINKNGENSPTTNIDWGGYKITNLANGSGDADSATVGQMNTADATIQAAADTAQAAADTAQAAVDVIEASVTDTTGSSTSLIPTQNIATRLATTSTQGQVQLSDSDTSTSTSLAATIASVTRRARKAAAETISAIWTFSVGPVLDHNISLSGKNSGGTSRTLLGIVSNVVTLGHNSQATTIQNNGDCNITNHAGATRELHQLIMWAQAKSDGTGLLISGTNIASVSRASLGIYTVTLSTGVTITANTIIAVSPNSNFSSGPRMAAWEVASVNTINVTIWDHNGNLSDTGFCLHVTSTGA